MLVPNLNCNTFSDNFGSKRTKKMAESVEELLKCQICLLQIKRPKMLPCQHSYCKKPCLEILVKNAQTFGHNLECFICHKIHQIPNGGIDGFPDNLLLISLLKVNGENLASESDSTPEEPPKSVFLPEEPSKPVFSDLAKIKHRQSCKRCQKAFFSKKNSPEHLQ